VDFLAFDIFVKFKNGEKWLVYNEYSKLFAKFRIPFNKLLFEGTWQETLDYPNEFVTTISQEKKSESICEGVVIKPTKPVLLEGSKIMIKNKNAKFCEKKFNPAKKKIIEPTPTKILDILDYVNKERLINVVSKIDKSMLRNDKKTLRMLMDDFCQDIMEDYLKKYGDHLNEKELKRVNKIMGTNSVKIVRNYLRNL
jgi:Rnl2 family RNA ligase